MNKPLDPGPPLTPEEEYCAHDPPTGAETAKAIGVAALSVLAGGISWFVIALATQRLWSFVTVGIGVLTGLAMYRAAGRHRSQALGIIAGVATTLASGVGYALLWLPFVRDLPVDKQLSWGHLIMLCVGIFAAYRITGPQATNNERST